MVVDDFVLGAEAVKYQAVDHYPSEVQNDDPRDRVAKYERSILPVVGREAQTAVGDHHERLVETAEQHDYHPQVVAGDAQREGHVVLLIQVLLDTVGRDQVLRDPRDRKHDHPYGHVHQPARNLLEYVDKRLNHLMPFLSRIPDTPLPRGARALRTRTPRTASPPT